MLFRVEDFLVKHKEDTLKDKVLNKIIGANKRAVLNPKVVANIKGIFRHTDYSIGLVCFEKEWYSYTDKFKAKIIDLPIRDIHIIASPLDIFYMLTSGEYTYYVDDNEEKINKVGHSHCMTLDEINYIIKGGQRLVK